MRLQWKTFGGIVPRMAPRNLPDIASQTCNNAWLAERNLQPLKAPATVTALPDSNQESIYLWRRGGGEEWLSWDKDIDICQGPIADDPYSTLYYTDGSTLHRIRWIGGVKTENADVSMAPSGSPTVTVRQIVTTSNIRMVNTDGNGHYEAGGVTTPDSVVLVGNILTVIGPVPTVPDVAFGLLVPYKAGIAGDRVVAEKNVQKAIYRDDGSTLYGYFEILGYSSDGTTITYTCKLDFPRSSSQSFYWVVANVDAYGQESPISSLSNMVSLDPNQYASISTDGGRLYRSAQGAKQANFFFVADVGANYSDFLSDSQLAESMPMIENPPAAMTGLVSAAGGFLVAFNGKEIYMSEPYLPYSWPTKYRLTMDYDVVGLAVHGNDVIVVTVGVPYILSGSHPDNVSQTKLQVEQSCVSKRSIAHARHAVLYASPDGLVSISGAGDVKVITEPYYTRTQWQALSPETMIGSCHDNRYIGFSDATGMVFDFTTPEYAMTTTDIAVQGRFVDLEDDLLYLIQDGNITSWMQGATVLMATWRSKEYQAVTDLIPSSAKIIAQTYTNITFKLYRNDIQVWTYVVPNDVAFRLPNYDRTGNWSVGIDTEDTIHDFRVASSMEQLRMEQVRI